MKIFRIFPQLDENKRGLRAGDRFSLRCGDAERKASAWDTSIDARMVGWANSVHRHSPSRPQHSSCDATLFVGGANKPSSAHPSPTRTTAQEKPHRPGIAASPPSTRGPCALRSRACKGRAGWGVDGEGEKAAQRGEVGGVGGVQGHRARRTSKQDMFCTFPGTCKHKLMRFGEGTESSAHLFHANRTGAPPSSRADALDSPNAATSEPPERACETDREFP